MEIELLEPRDANNEAEAIRRCVDGHVYQFTRLDDGQWIGTHRHNGGKAEILAGANAVSSQAVYDEIMRHHRNLHD